MLQINDWRFPQSISIGMLNFNKYEVLIDALMQRLNERDIDILESLVIIEKLNVIIYILCIPYLSDIPDISDIM